MDVPGRNNPKVLIRLQSTRLLRQFRWGDTLDQKRGPGKETSDALLPLFV